jgi:hypothetical protein
MALNNTNHPAHTSATEGGSTDLLQPGVLPRVIKVDTSTGCTLTRAQISGLTPKRFAEMKNTEIHLARTIANATEAKMLGVVERGFTDLLNSSVRNIKPLVNKIKVAGQSVIMPFIQRRQRSVLNANYFVIADEVSAGEFATGEDIGTYKAMTTGSIGANREILIGQGEHGYINSTLRTDTWKLKINLGSSDWKTPIPNPERYFMPGGFVIVSSWFEDAGNSNAPNAYESQFEIVGSKGVDGDDSSAIVLLNPVGGDVPAGGFASTVAVPEHYKPTHGVVQTLANNVNDYEAWCYNQPTNLNVKLIVNWLQTSRDSRIVNQEYKDTLKKIMNGEVNPFLNSMVYQPLADQNKQAAQRYYDDMDRACWFNQPINEEQNNPNNYENLPTVSDPEDPNCTLEYKANALGIKTMLYNTGRVRDLMGDALDLDTLFGDLYYLKRNREQDGDKVLVIDGMTDRITANNIFEAMNKYFIKKYDWTVERSAKIDQKIEHNGIILFNYNIYDIPEVGVQLAIFHDPFFDDMINVVQGQYANSTANTNAMNRSRALWLLDWSDIRKGVAGSNSVTRKSPNAAIDRLYRCRMNSVSREYSLRSETWTAMLDRPHRHLLLENFSNEVTVSYKDDENTTVSISKSGSLTYTPPLMAISQTAGENIHGGVGDDD